MSDTTSLLATEAVAPQPQERQLYAAMLDQAIEDLRCPRLYGDNGTTREEVYETAVGYLFSEDSDEAFEVLGIDATVARKLLASEVRREA